MRRAELLLALVAVAVATTGRAGDHGAVEAALTPHLEAALGARAIDLHGVRVDSVDGPIPGDAELVDVELGILRSLAGVRIVATFTAGERRLVRRLRCSLEADVPIAITTRSVARGQRLAGRVRFERRRMSGVVAGLVIASSPSALLALEARRRLIPGSIVRSADVRAAAEVEQGEMVTATGKHDGVDIVVNARALSSGRSGEVVPVRVFASGSPVQALVVGRRQVELLERGRR